MKTAKSSISKDLAGRLLVDVALKKAEHWTRQEFEKLRNSDAFVCVPLADKILAIGRFQVEELSQTLWKVSHGDNPPVYLRYKLSAIFYAIYTQKMMFNRAKRILDQDLAASLYKEKMDFYSVKLSGKNTALFDRDLYTIRYTDFKIKYKNAKQELEKTLIRAKYSKVWDSLL